VEPQTLYASWTETPAIGAENEVQFLAADMTFSLPAGYADCVVECATEVVEAAWNFAPLDPSEYAVLDGSVVVYFSPDRPKAIYRALFSP